MKIELKLHMDDDGIVYLINSENEEPLLWIESDGKIELGDCVRVLDGKHYYFPEFEYLIAKDERPDNKGSQ